MSDPEHHRTVAVAGLDDHPVVMAGVEASLARRGGQYRWLGSAASWAELDTRLAEWPVVPDVVIVDLHVFDGSDPGEGIAALVRRGISVVAFAAEPRPIPVRRAVATGASGLVLKADSTDALLTVLDEVSTGRFAASSDLARDLLTDTSRAALLTPRELAVLSLLAAGVPRKAVGSRLDPPVGHATVVTYIRRIYRRYRAIGRNVATIGDALREAAADGYITPERPHA
jgi:DNA-binding NarL/FixJ family response regulator